MISRKNLLIAGIATVATAGLIGKAMGSKVKSSGKVKNGKPLNALVFWYSQTGNTEKVGRAIASAWKKAGLNVTSGDYRDIDKNSLDKYDIIAAGTPVYYYEVPENYRDWLKNIPQLNGTPFAAFVTFGGEGGNQHNTVCELSELLAEKGGIPAGTAEFSCMSTYALTWSSGNVTRILKYKERPGIETYAAAGSFAVDILQKTSAGISAEVSGNFSLRNIIKGPPSIGTTKLLITGHRVDTGKCINCGRCRRACTVDAIDPDRGTVDTDKCIACLGCINNCPVGAVEMKFLGKEVYGYREFIKRNRITPAEPEA